MWNAQLLIDLPSGPRGMQTETNAVQAILSSPSLANRCPHEGGRGGGGDGGASSFFVCWRSFSGVGCWLAKNEGSPSRTGYLPRPKGQSPAQAHTRRTQAPHNRDWLHGQSNGTTARPMSKTRSPKGSEVGESPCFRLNVQKSGENKTGEEMFPEMF